MKKLFITFFLVLLVPSLLLAAPFLPTRLQLTIPDAIQYNFDGSTLDIPVNVSGTAARCYFFVYTKDKGDEIGEVQNGYLGWHYVNKIDTCIYMSPQTDLTIGDKTITWAGVDNDGGTVPPGDYTYYVFAYDFTSPPELTIAMPTEVDFHGGGGLNTLLVKELDEAGLAVDAPYVLDINTDGILRKWILGSDPLDPGLVETCDLQIPEEWRHEIPSPASPKFDDHSTIYFGEANHDALVLAIRKATWVPNDLATRDTEWGFESGECYWAMNGPLDDGNYIYTGKYDIFAKEACSTVYILDYDANIIAPIQNDFHIKPEEYQRAVDLGVGCRYNGGPRLISNRDGASLLVLMSGYGMHSIGDPLRYLVSEEYTDFVPAFNQNGDYVMDKAWAPDHKAPWLNFIDESPWYRTLYPDANYFCVGSQSAGAVSFGLMAPDFTGVGMLNFAGEAGTGAPRRSIFIQRDTAYDGWYVRGQVADPGGVGYIGHDSVKGLLTDTVGPGVADASPSVFAVEQNSPNPANPTTTISFILPGSGTVTVDIFNVAGQKVDTLVNDFMDSGRHSVVWNGSNFSTGVYFYTVKSGEFSKTMKMTLLK